MVVNDDTIFESVSKKTYDIVQQLYRERDLSDENLLWLIQNGEYDEILFEKADSRRREFYKNEVYLRGLIEFTNYCKNDCYYCGIRRGNKSVKRYRMTFDEILFTCEQGYKLGYHTFVLQGGEDPYYTDEKICQIVSEIRNRFPECAITLSLGEKGKESYQAYFDAGANRYLLRHETASNTHYRKIHPKEMKLENRKRCLFELKEIGYQVGAGFMVESPFQKAEDLLSDLRFLKELQPDMIGMGPFISQKDTPFKDYQNGSLELSLRMIAILRLMFPYALIPATTALGTIHPQGRELGLKAGANVVMPNLTPSDVRENYLLYDNKICIGDEPGMCRSCIEQRVSKAGYQVVMGIGDVRHKHNN